MAPTCSSAKPGTPIRSAAFDWVRYWYTNGRPSRVEVASTSSDLQTLNGYSTYYLQYNWHGDVVVWVAPAGDGTNSITLTTDPWGVYSSDTFQYYLWNGAWGYLYFSPLKLYYVHGRWYDPETALWLSPDENGEYLYGSGQDAVNWAWRIRQNEPCQAQNGPSDCEKFVQDVQRAISIAQASGASDSLTVMLLAQYYSGIPATWNFFGVTISAIGGIFDPVAGRSFASVVLPFPDLQDRWVEPKGIHDQNSQGQALRLRYGFKRVFFTNTHHYFAEFHLNWFWGGIFDVENWSRNREIDQYKNRGQPYSETAADIAVSVIAREHVKRIKTLRNTIQYGAFIGEHSALPGRAIQVLPQLLAQDACGNSDPDIYARWPPPNIEKILGPNPDK